MIAHTARPLRFRCRIRIRVNAALRAKHKNLRRHAPLNPGKKIHKDMKHIVPVIAVATVLTLGAWTTVSAEEENEQTVKMSDLPAAAQTTIKDKAGSNEIVKIEKKT